MADHFGSSALTFHGVEVRIIRSARRTLALEVKSDAVLVRAPAGVADGEIQAFLHRHGDWLAKKLRQRERRRREYEQAPPLTQADIRALADRAAAYIPERVRFYAPKVGVTYGRITIRHQRTRWGSCSAKGNLNFNCLLMLAPPEVIDSVVVHELCHRKEMNHSKRFYAEVLRVFPEYYERHRWLAENGEKLLHRASGAAQFTP